MNGINGLSNLGNIEKTSEILDSICNNYNYNILNKIYHKFEPVGFTILYLLSESHLSIHTFPERNYIAVDLYTCRESETNETYFEIYNLLLEKFEATGTHVIINRTF